MDGRKATTGAGNLIALAVLFSSNLYFTDGLTGSHSKLMLIAATRVLARQEGPSMMVNACCPGERAKMTVILWP